MTLDVETLVRRTDSVSSLPMIFNRINDAVNNPRSSISEIGKIISEDSGLTARLLKIVNSAFYSFPSKIETISRAVTIVGTQQLRDLALATSVMSLFKGVSEDLMSMNSFWCHSVACGTAARVIATQRRESNVERFFVAGMLHDIGRLVLCVKMPDTFRSVLLQAQVDRALLYKVEMKELGFDHASIGGALLQSWKLPASLEEAVTCHHRPNSSVRYPVESAVIHLADIISHALGLGSSGERFVPALDAHAWDRLGIEPSQLPLIVKQIDLQYQEAVQTILGDAK
ncbi:MAG: HDOD domain-containing protein [Acidobacteriota bacterium]